MNYRGVISLSLISSLALSACSRHPGAEEEAWQVDAMPHAALASGERYDGKGVSPIHRVSAEPVSTFAVDVDTGAYANVRRLLRIGLRGYDVASSQRPPANLVFMVDVSGSMQDPDKLPLVKQALSILADSLRPDDNVSIITYAGWVNTLAEGSHDPAEIKAALSGLDAEGSTAGGPALSIAYNLARAHRIPGGINRIVMATVISTWVCRTRRGLRTWCGTCFAQESATGASFLKSGIETRNTAFNAMIDEIEQVASRTRAPILLMGPTGAGKSQLARRVHDLKKLKRQVVGPFIEVNCATLRGDGAMSASFGHRKGAFTSAASERPGLLRSADGGMLFLDEIGELGLDEQAMILRAIEEKRFLPMGADVEVGSDFQLIAGTNRDLDRRVAEGTFREDLYARLNLWTFTLPGIARPREDIEPNLDYELDRYAEREGERASFNKEARTRWRLRDRQRRPGTATFATLPRTSREWRRSRPRDASTLRRVDGEVTRLQRLWSSTAECSDGLDEILSPTQLAEIDPFDRVQLAYVWQICEESASLSEAGRRLFAASRVRRASTNDADRLRKYLTRFGLNISARR